MQARDKLLLRFDQDLVYAMRGQVPERKVIDSRLMPMRMTLAERRLCKIVLRLGACTARRDGEISPSLVPPYLGIRDEGFVIRPMKQTELRLVLYSKVDECLALIIKDPLRMVEVDDQICRLGAVGASVELESVELGCKGSERLEGWLRCDLFPTPLLERAHRLRRAVDPTQHEMLHRPELETLDNTHGEDNVGQGSSQIGFCCDFWVQVRAVAMESAREKTFISFMLLICYLALILGLEGGGDIGDGRIVRGSRC